MTFKFLLAPLGNLIWTFLEFLFFRVCYYLAAIPYWLITRGKRPLLRQKAHEDERIILSIVGVQAAAIYGMIVLIVMY